MSNPFTDQPAVFVSYSSQSVKQAEISAAILNNMGFASWVAKRDIKPGADWVLSLAQAIDRSHALVVLLCRDAQNSDEVARELQMAGSRKIPVFAIRLESLRLETRCEYLLKTNQWRDAFDEHGARNDDRLIGALNELSPLLNESRHNRLIWRKDLRISKQPRDYVSREMIIKDTINRIKVAADTSKKPVVCIIYGVSGSGKTVLADDICDDLGMDNRRVPFSEFRTADYMLGHEVLLLDDVETHSSSSAAKIKSIEGIKSHLILTLSTREALYQMRDVLFSSHQAIVLQIDGLTWEEFSQSIISAQERQRAIAAEDEQCNILRDETALSNLYNCVGGMPLALQIILDLTARRRYDFNSPLREDETSDRSSSIMLLISEWRKDLSKDADIFIDIISCVASVGISSAVVAYIAGDGATTEAVNQALLKARSRGLVYVVRHHDSALSVHGVVRDAYRFEIDVTSERYISYALNYAKYLIGIAQNPDRIKAESLITLMDATANATHVLFLRSVDRTNRINELSDQIYFAIGEIRRVLFGNLSQPSQQRISAMFTEHLVGHLSKLTCGQAIGLAREARYTNLRHFGIGQAFEVAWCNEGGAASAFRRGTESRPHDDVLAQAECMMTSAFHWACGDKEQKKWAKNQIIANIERRKSLHYIADYLVAAYAVSLCDVSDVSQAVAIVGGWAMRRSGQETKVGYLAICLYIDGICDAPSRKVLIDFYGDRLRNIPVIGREFLRKRGWPFSQTYGSNLELNREMELFLANAARNAAYMKFLMDLCDLSVPLSTDETQQHHIAISVANLQSIRVEPGRW